MEFFRYLIYLQVSIRSYLDRRRLLESGLQLDDQVGIDSELSLQLLPEVDGFRNVASKNVYSGKCSKSVETK